MIIEMLFYIAVSIVAVGLYHYVREIVLGCKGAPVESDCSAVSENLAKYMVLPDPVPLDLTQLDLIKPLEPAPLDSEIQELNSFIDGL